MRVIFMGTPDFALRAFIAIDDSPHEVVAVYTQPPRPAGRGHGERRSPVHERALAHRIPVYTPARLKEAEAQMQFTAVCADLAADIAVVTAYGLILPKPVLEAPRLGCINIHASLLPRWRGAAPIQRAILAGDAKTGVTIMQMDEGLDTGAILAAEEIEIGPAATGTELHDRLAALGGRLAVDVLNRLEAGTIEPVLQPEAGAVYAAKLSRAEGRLDWRRPAAELERRVRAFSPWPGAWFVLDGTRIKVLAATVTAGVAGAAPGEMVDDRLTVACGGGALRIEELQREGRKPQKSAEFLRGFPVPPGTRLPLREVEGGDIGGGAA